MSTNIGSQDQTRHWLMVLNWFIDRLRFYDPPDANLLANYRRTKSNTTKANTHP